MNAIRWRDRFEDLGRNSTTRNAGLKGDPVKAYASDLEAAAAPISSNAWIKRSGVERRSGAEKRHDPGRVYFLSGGTERRRADDRRKSGERRDGWLSVGNWRSICVFDPGK
jgi:hypothetical protein